VPTPRRVLYDERSPAATAAARCLPGEFEVLPLPHDAGVPDVRGAVVLVGGDSTVSGGGQHRVIAFVDAGPDGAWPDDWYALLPLDPPAPLLQRTLRNAFMDLDAAADVARLERELSELNAIGIRLSSERDPLALLHLILRKAREITHSDAGSLYLVEEDAAGRRVLRFAVAQNDSIEIPFQTSTMPLSRESLAGWVALEGRPLNVADAYALPRDAPFRINRSFDERVGYRTKSMLVVPMQTPQGVRQTRDTIGVLQLINCKPDFAERLTSVERTEHVVIPFGARYVALASSLASQAAVALENTRLYESIRRLFDGFVSASTVAIESRDPVTAGHSERVARLTVRLAEVVDRTAHGPYATVRFTRGDLTELHYASLLHDFGKVGVREHLLQKAKKLHPDALERILGRVEAFKRGVEIAVTRRKLALALDKGPVDYEAHAPALDAELRAALTELDAGLARILAANEPTVLTSEAADEIRQLARHVVDDPYAGRQPIITLDEAEILAIGRGSLTDEELREVRAHVTHSMKFLASIPWTREFRRIPEIAGAHHERLDGTGYPQGLRAETIPLQSRMMTIADIYDALTAFDRPYKPAVTPALAFEILDEERRAHHIDGTLLDLFIEARVWEASR
jgi:HD-GYP domain-containing protein (c-di-GMP phosphodiesterase class II)